jgi:hypothetical protein
MMREVIAYHYHLIAEKLRSEDRAPRSIHSSAFDVVIASLDVSTVPIGKSSG